MDCPLRDNAYDFAQVHSVRSMSKFAPTTVEQLADFLRYNTGPIAIRGAGYSHGGHTLIENGVQIDMSQLRKIHFDVRTSTVIVMAGAIWYDVIRHLATFGRTVAEMQSYYSFSVGGSIAVNCHGRGLEFGTISDTIIDLTVMMADGVILSCSPSNNHDLFRGIIGGYGLLAIIISATLRTAPNQKVKLEVTSFPTKMITSIIAKALERDNVFFNANIYPTNLSKTVCYTWKQSPMPLTIKDVYASQKGFYPFSMVMGALVRRFKSFKHLRARWEPKMLNQNSVAMRSFAIANDVDELATMTRWISTTILQEYFVPVRHLQKFLWRFLPASRQINTINISLRFVKKARLSLLNYAPENMISVVIYLNIWNVRPELEKLTEWTDRQIEYLVKLDGIYYLPYLLCYDYQQLSRMYPKLREFAHLKQYYDNKNKLRGMFYDHIRYCLD